MMARLTEAERRVLADADPWTYCGYEPARMAAAIALQADGFGRVDENDLGPIFYASEAGRAALKEGTP